MEVFLLGIATAANFILLKWKWDRGRIEDLTWDLVILIALSVMFGGTMTGMAIAMIGGASIYKQALELDLVDELFITHMNWEGEADTFLRLDLSKWNFVDTLSSYSGEVGPTWSQKHYIKGIL